MTWDDAQYDGEYDGSPEKAGGSIQLTAIGFLVRKTRKEVVLAMDMDPKSRDVRFIFTIPTKMVVKIQDLLTYDEFKAREVHHGNEQADRGAHPAPPPERNQ